MYENLRAYSIYWTCDGHPNDNSGLYVFPEFYLEPNTYIMVVESDGVDTDEYLYTDGQIRWRDDWDGSCALIDNYGIGIDFVPSISLISIYCFVFDQCFFKTFASW